MPGKTLRMRVNQLKKHTHTHTTLFELKKQPVSNLSQDRAAECLACPSLFFTLNRVDDPKISGRVIWRSFYSTQPPGERGSSCVVRAQLFLFLFDLLLWRNIESII